MNTIFSKIRKWITDNARLSIGIALVLMACMVGPFVEHDERGEETHKQDVLIKIENMNDEEKDEVKEDLEKSK